jgi:hypothetical protein
MSEENLELAYKVMGAFIKTKDPKGYTKDALVISYEIEPELAEELVDAAYREWSEAYGA